MENESSVLNMKLTFTGYNCKIELDNSYFIKDLIRMSTTREIVKCVDEIFVRLQDSGHWQANGLVLTSP